MTVMEDVELVDLAVGGDAAAFELLVRRHTDAVWRVARSMVGDHHGAEDVVQETFVKAYRGLGQFRRESSVRTWLLTICHRSCIEVHRRRRAHVVALDEVRHRAAREETVELRLLIAQAVEGLSSDERVAFTLVDVLGHSREEAAAVVGVPASTMRSRVARARTQVLAAVSDDDVQEEEAR